MRVRNDVKWAAELSGVQEVSLLGVADLAYWAQRLGNWDVVPVGRDGKAQIMIIAAAARFAGVRFSELSLSVLVAPPHGVTCENCACLLQAYNSRRLLAFCERAFFSTPYEHGQVHIAVSPFAGIALGKRGQIVFRAQMEAARPGGNRESVGSGQESWEGAVLLPIEGQKTTGMRKLFFAKLGGSTRRFAFQPEADSLALEPSPSVPLVNWLADSRFMPTEWILREKASHAKSRTYKCPKQS